MSENEPVHWRRHVDADGVCRLVLDQAGSSANTLSHAVLSELDRLIAALDPGEIKGLVFESAKASGFILGADVHEFSALESAERASAMARQGQELFARIEALPVPTVAAIAGYALGGGLELALACDYRVAAEGYERNLGLPEVQLGIHPGFGGTVRAVRLLGAPTALDFMLTGRSMSPKEALAAGLVDRVVAAAELQSAAKALVARPPPRRRAPWHLRVLNAAPLRPFVAARVRAALARRVRAEHYPAPGAIVDLWARHGASDAGYAAEADSIGRLMVGQTSRNLVRVFGLRERLRGLAPKKSDIGRVHVVGAGVMGGDIAAWCALRGLSVSLQDREARFVESAIARAGKLFDRRLQAPGEADAARQRLAADVAGERVDAADLVLEAIVEDLEAKQSLYRDIEPRLDAGAIIATNTSSLRLESLAPALSAPGRFVGLHFFNPVAKMPLVEVIEGDATDRAALERAMSFITAIGKLPLPCRSAPGFVVNRILTPYMLEALRIAAEGHVLETVDAAAEAFGMPVGPVELADRVGLDVALKVAEILAPVLGTDVPDALRDKVAAGELGAKTGSGFYRYENDRAQKRRDVAPPDAEMRDRLILPMINEAMKCWREGVVAETDLVDAGAVFGAGFAPFTGGPIHYARERGIDDVVASLERLATRHGSRFEPDPGWRDTAQEIPS